MPHTDLLDAALAEARRSFDTGGIPIGAAIADPSGAVVSGAHNRLLFESGDITSHAELGSVRDLGLADLTGYTLLTTMPPCWMCGGALRHFRLSRLLVVRQPFDSGAAAWLAADDSLDMVVERVESSEAVDMFESWRSTDPERWPNPRLERW